MHTHTLSYIVIHCHTSKESVMCFTLDLDVVLFICGTMNNGATFDRLKASTVNTYAVLREIGKSLGKLVSKIDLWS